ncbi:hypothetical protein AAFF_G00377390 [Aldrovandia affinis]|uniref:Uncharacterized protein n=1 Tax=Aldrovandia affinis TaxID=143900 RepID=A0AAD7SFZ1_9TELE|nr:hypothetical protein AAFF_G00377390 [Aldrovandia affinis]
MAKFPEAVAVYFVSGICAGLVFLLCLFGLRSTLVRDVKDLFSELKEEMTGAWGPCPELAGDLDDDTSSDSSSHRLTRSYRAAGTSSPERTVEKEEEAEHPQGAARGL